MSYLYVIEQGASISFTKNRFVIQSKGSTIGSYPVETVEILEIFGNVQVTTQCLKECLTRGINILFFSTMGSYFGRLISTSHVNTERQRLQARHTEDPDFRLRFSKRIIDAKIGNQIVLLRRYGRSRNIDVRATISEIQIMQRKAWYTTDIRTLMGYEGRAARLYFEQLGKLVNPEFAFNKRSRRPPMDAFNSMLSLGYSIVMHEIYGKIEGKGLNAYFGVMHEDREKHPTLASDLMEEWRAVLVDATVMSLINGNEMDIQDFYSEEGRDGVFLNDKAFRIFVTKLENKLLVKNSYLNTVEYSISFRQAMDIQVNQFVKTLETGNPDLYMPVKIR